MSTKSIRTGGLTLTTGNTKLGRVLNISLPPPASCDLTMPCFAKGCYAMRSCYGLYPEVRTAWDGNMRVWREGGPLGYFSAVREAVAKAKPELFRWHVGGDIPDNGYDGEGDAYAGGICAVADDFPDVRFRIFTKRYAVVRRNAKMLKSCPNLTVSLSMWPGVKCHAATLKAWSASWVRDPKNPDPRIPADAKECSGRCDTCQLCWGLKPGESVVFDKH